LIHNATTFQDQPVGHRRDGRAARLLEKWFLSSYLGRRAWQIPSEQHYKEHRAAYYKNIKIGLNYYELNYDLCVPSYVLDEFIALAQSRKLSREAALDFSERLIDDADIETVWVDETRHREALALLRVRTDKAYTLCDAVSFVLMRERGITEALTTDRHFEQEGFVRLLIP